MLVFTFTIATYNIHKCRGLDRRVRPDRIVEVLKETGADIIALQEVVGMDHADRQHNQVRWIADELGFHYWRKSEPRGRLEVLLELGGHEAIHRLRIFNVHLGTGYFERRYQSKMLLDVQSLFDLTFWDVATVVCCEETSSFQQRSIPRSR